MNQKRQITLLVPSWQWHCTCIHVIYHGQEVYISDIPPAVEASRWYITDIHRLDMVHILYIMLNFDEVYISDIPPAVSIATWYIYIYIRILTVKNRYHLCQESLDIASTVGICTATAPPTVGK